MSRKTLAVKKKVDKKDRERTVHALQAMKVISMLVLRNQGYGKKRMTRFNDHFNEILEDVMAGRISLQDIADTIYDETGVSLDNLVAK